MLKRIREFFQRRPAAQPICTNEKTGEMFARHCNHVSVDVRSIPIIRPGCLAAAEMRSTVVRTYTCCRCGESFERDGW